MLTSSKITGTSRTGLAGFTLIELMIAVVIAAILAAVAFPSYLGFVRKGRRADAVSYLTSIQQAQERWRANNQQYSTVLSSLPPGFSSTSPSGYYDVSVEPTADATNCILTATAKTGTSQANDALCLTLRLQLAGGTVAYGGCASCAAPTPPDLVSDPDRCWAR
jgi:type IV pilus assembly protein PilE